MASVPTWLKAIAPNLFTPGSEPSIEDFVITVPIAILLLLVRVAFDSVVLPAVKKALGPGREKAAGSVYDNLWIALFSGTLTSLAWVVTIADNDGCTPWHTKPCFIGWPHHHVTAQARWYMLLATAYYLYELIGTVLKVIGLAARIGAFVVLLRPACAGRGADRAGAGSTTTTTTPSFRPHDWKLTDACGRMAPRRWARS